FWFPENCSDGDGGMIVVWQDWTMSCYVLFAQRIDPYGNLLWPEGGITINGLETGDQLFHRVIPDGEGGAIVVWINDYTGLADIYAQRLDKDGNLLWGPNGVPVCTATGQQYGPELVSDGKGGAIVTWADHRGMDNDIYVQKIEPDGTVSWAADGLVVNAETGTQEDPAIASDNNGGAIIVWEDNRGADQDIYIRGVNAYGYLYWLSTGIPVCTATGWQESPAVTSDGAGGVIVAWGDSRITPYAVYAQRIDRYGIARWEVDGSMISDPGIPAGYPVVIADGNGGTFVSYRGGSAGSLYLGVLRISSMGESLWGAVIYETEYMIEQPPVMVSDGAGGVIVCWADDRVGNYDVYAQRYSGEGAMYWEFGGRVVCSEFEDQTYVRVVTDDHNGAIMSFHDLRMGVQNIFVQRITAEGFWGYPCPDIYSVNDVPGDQGGQVNVAWYASRVDESRNPVIAHYSIWRAIEESSPLLSIDSGAAMAVDATGVTLETKPGAIRSGTLLGEPYFWQLVGTVPAAYLEAYGETVPTLFDFTDSSPGNHYFQVISHTEDPLTFWISEPDSGVSVDNLAPAMPLALTGEQVFSPGGLQLTWDPNSEPDLAGYNVYRGTSSGFLPGPGSFVTSTPDTASFDGDWDWAAGYWYKVAAVDIHGNESVFAVLGPDMVTGDDPIPLPDVTFLSQNLPNPFNPVTTISFGLGSDGHVDLSIYDAAGRLVAVLIDDSRPAGSYVAEWNGRSASGAKAASGVYFYRLITKGFDKTKKMVLLR
ncbi:MAG TPA: T9SS type A sorting domain-containing protein, partial [Candidatus Krumholzibacterium sp.]|nr:T9SS type A sorting domain-containing protein [Candidatus Krumholzibacterium sp.]